MTVSPVPRGTGWREVGRCFGAGVGMLRRRELHLPRKKVGRVIRFGDGTPGRVDRETVWTGRQTPRASCSCHSGCEESAGTRCFGWRASSTPRCSSGSRGFVSKLWLANDRDGIYRGLYEWDGADRAERYARVAVASAGARQFRGFDRLPGWSPR
jgi:hypothetical protein